MTKDKEIEELFHAQKPHFDDGDEFMKKLTKRLDAVEIVKQYQERTLRRYRIVIAVAFVVGIISGTVSTIWLLSSPIELPSVNFQTQTFAACIITSNVLEIVEMRRKMKEEYI